MVRRIRKVVIVALFTTSVLVTALWVVTTEYPLQFGGYIGKQYWLTLRFGHHHLHIQYAHRTSRPRSTQTHNLSLGLLGELGLYSLDAARSTWRYHNVLFPIWLSVLALISATAILWYRDRSPPKGHCQTCGYDLTGNVSGVCPECGEKT